MKKIITSLILVILLQYFPAFYIEAKAPAKIKITSTAFSNKCSIPTTHACEFLGQDKSPPLSFSNVPAGTQSLALILDDPDAPGGTFNHWVIFNIQASEGTLEEGIPRDGELEGGIKQGTNGTSQIGYFGPCPPPKETHRYIFKVFALDTVLNLEAGADKKQLLKAMKTHILGRGKLVGLFKNNTDF